MNLKKSKFFKRIQKLRRISQEKLRKENECNNGIDLYMENIFHERGGISQTHENLIDEQDPSVENIYDDVDENSSNKLLKIQHHKFITPQGENLPFLSDKSNKNCGLIQLDNACYQVRCFTEKKCKSVNDNTDSMPSISSISASICVCNSRYGLIGTTAKSLAFKIVKENKLWNILWTDSLPGVDVYKSMKRFQQINHFPGMIEICRKDLLSRNLNRMLKLYPKDYKIFPKTWIFPADYGEALNYANNTCYKSKTFIIKPDAGAQGRGIWLTNDLKNVSTTDRMICQTYIAKPLLIDGYKFDLRVYALITSVDPLRIYVYNEGLARFATNKYREPTTDNSADLFMDLTNYSVNKRNSQYELCDDDDCGSKRKFSAINNWMRRRNYNVDEFWSRIDDIIIKTVLSAWPILRHNYNACFPGHDKIQACFEILGFDILVDSKMKPYVLEVNHSPSFHTNEVVDRQVKKSLIRDTLSLVSTALVDKRKILREDRKRINQRLLRSRLGNISERSNTNTGVIPLEDKSPTNNVINESPLSALAQQIAWEESHLGNYRRIMPPNDQNKLSYYCQFYGQQNQASIFAETAASKKREEVSKKLRKDLEAKKKMQTEMLKHKSRTLRFEERQKRRALKSRQTIENQRQSLLRSQAHWAPGYISYAEEHLRSATMQMRTDMLKDLKIMELIYTNQYNTGNLTNTDIIKFPDLHSRVKDESDNIVTPTSKMQQFFNL